MYRASTKTNIVDLRVGRRLRALRLGFDRELAAQAKELGIEIGTLKDIEDGRKRASALLLFHVCRSLGVRPEAIYGDDVVFPPDQRSTAVRVGPR